MSWTVLTFRSIKSLALIAGTFRHPFCCCQCLTSSLSDSIRCVWDNEIKGESRGWIPPESLESVCGKFYYYWLRNIDLVRTLTFKLATIKIYVPRWWWYLHVVVIKLTKWCSGLLTEVLLCLLRVSLGPNIPWTFTFMFNILLECVQ